MDKGGLVAAIPGRALPLDREKVVWKQHDGERTVVLPALDAAVIAHATLFRPPELHASIIATALRLPTEQVVASLQRLASSGFMVDASRLLPSAAAAAAAPEPLICIRTCARPGSLDQLLKSLLDDERRFGVQRRYVILDDSPDAAMQSATRKCATAFARSTSSEVRLLDASGQAVLLEALGLLEHDAASLLSRECAATASGGRSWNWSLLLAAGGTLALLDDDFRFPLRLPRGALPGIDLVTGPETDAEFFDGVEWSDALAAVDEDPYAVLSRPLGQRAGALLESDSFSLDSLFEQSPGGIACLADPARVVAVCTGIYGALNYDSTVYLSGPNPETLKSLFRAPFNEDRLNGDALWLGRRQSHFMKTGVFTPLAVDAREMLPPTGTYGKSDDGLFYALLSVCDPHGIVMELPAAIGHFPPPGRRRREVAEQPAIEDLSTFCGSVAMSLASLLGSSRREARLAVVASLMSDIAAASDRELTRRYLAWRDDRALRIIQMLHLSLRGHAPGAPSEWVAHVRRAISANEAVLSERTMSSARLASVRAALSQLASGIEAWPSIWEKSGSRLLALLETLD